MPAIDRLFQYMVQQGASDLHITSESYPYLRINGQIEYFGQKQLSAKEAEALVMEIVPEANKLEMTEYNDTDFGYYVPGLGRFRANVFKERRGISAVYRYISNSILTCEEIGLPETVQQLCYLNKGLVLVTGPTGSGKTTTLASMVDLINEAREVHMITLEDPIEFVHNNKRALIRQREMGVHAKSFSRALRAALREDPDVILIGEMRDLETTKIAMETAETGHLVLATLHTSSAPKTIDRLIDQFPAGKQSQIRSMLADSLKAVVSQTLCRTADGMGRVLALEVMIVNIPVANNIRDGKIHQIPMAMQTGKRLGMCTLNDSLLELARGGIVTAEEAWLKSVDRPALLKEFQRYGVPFTPPKSAVTDQ